MLKAKNALCFVTRASERLKQVEKHNAVTIFKRNVKNNNNKKKHTI